MANPWFKFYPSNWRADPKLRICSLAARGLWIELIQIMHESEPRGHLLVNGNKPTTDELSTLIGARVEDVETYLPELERAGVFSRKKNGVIFSRKMEKDENLSRKRRETGKMGGNPNLCKVIEKKGLVNQDLKPKSLEARSQRLEEESHGAAVAGQAGTDFLKNKSGRTWLWSDGVDHLIRTTDKTQQQAKSTIGHLLKRCDDDADKLVSHFIAALETGAEDIAGHIKAHIQIQQSSKLSGSAPEQVCVSVFDPKFKALAERHQRERKKRPMQAQSMSWFPKTWLDDLQKEAS